MASFALRFRSELRNRWRAWLGLALLIGAAGGASLAAATGARRTDTAYPRFVRAQNGSDVLTGGSQTEKEEDFVSGLEELKTLPQVAEWEQGYGFPFEIRTATGRSLSFPSLIAGGSATDRPRHLDIPKILRGRSARDDAVDEATVSFAAEAPDITIGSRLEIALGDPQTDPPPPRVQVRVVGIHAAPGEFQSLSSLSFPSLALSRGFIRTHETTLLALNPSDVRSVAFKLKNGARDVPAFRAEAARRNIPVELPLEAAEHVAGVQKTMRFEASALWLLSSLVGLAGLAIFGQSLARLAYFEASDYATLRALGMSRGHLAMLGIGRAAAIGAAAAVIAVALGILGSALTPIGTARFAEPSPGIAIDATILVLGAVAVLLLVVATGLWPSLRAARLTTASPGASEVTDAGRPSMIARLLTGAGAPPSVTSGVKFALEPGRGRTAVPVRTTIVGVIIGVASLTMALTFQASLAKLVRTPEYAGYRFDALVTSDPDEIAKDPDVEAVSIGGATNIMIGDDRMLAFIWRAGGDVGPVMLEGREPRTSDEVALGTTTMQREGVRIGGSIDVRLASSQGQQGPGSDAPQRYTVVGRAIIPQLFFEAHEPGEGAAMTLDAYGRLEDVPTEDIPALVRFRPGADLQAETQELRKNAFVAVRTTRGDVITIEKLSSLPIALSGLLAAMGAAALVHTLVSTIRRRRRDLAILKTLGFSHRQLSSTVLWQSASLVIVACVFALPAGVAAGRWAWQLFAGQIAVLPRPVVPIATTLLIVPATLAVALLAGYLPGRRASQTKPATVLRTE